MAHTISMDDNETRAMQNKRLEALKWPDPAELKNRKGQNILHVAAKAGNDIVVYILLGRYKQPDIIEKLVNAKDDDGNTPLHLASMHNHCEVMRLLTKDKRMDLSLRNNKGLTALDGAMESRRLSTENPALVGRAILIVAGVPRSGGRDVLLPGEQDSEVSKSSSAEWIKDQVNTYDSKASKSSSAEWIKDQVNTYDSEASKSSSAEWIKDQVNTLLLVATLVASVTFTAGLTLPGGYNASGDPHPGTATMLHHRMFRAFVIANMLAMYNSILAVVVLLWGLNRDFYVAELAYHSAGQLLLMALTGMSVAFFAAITVAVSRLTWLGSLVMSVGVLYLAMVVVVLAALIFPSSKTTMFIAVVYYIAVYTVRRYVKFCVEVFYYMLEETALSFIFRFQTVVRVCKRVFRLRESS
ncbi:protein ACCELERATED CELL DEATH 6-like [Eucalyptus grandis]|uniref:protein ACCELERATED CELL DEATH 6-like n=1 Tax=Eucalyptus grandis TaxID=71139 RepID=UPI00192EBBBB|nr:protein ACCELERATED CELL DEATH 6-like [Eucalyptus grandis]